MVYRWLNHVLTGLLWSAAAQTCVFVWVMAHLCWCIGELKLSAWRLRSEYANVCMFACVRVHKNRTYALIITNEGSVTEEIGNNGEGNLLSTSIAHTVCHKIVGCHWVWVVFSILLSCSNMIRMHPTYVRLLLFLSVEKSYLFFSQLNVAHLLFFSKLYHPIWLLLWSCIRPIASGKIKVWFPSFSWKFQWKFAVWSCHVSCLLLCAPVTTLSITIVLILTPASIHPSIYARMHACESNRSEKNMPTLKYKSANWHTIWTYFSSKFSKKTSTWSHYLSKWLDF